MKMTALDKTVIGLAILMLGTIVFLSIKTASYLRSDEFKKDAVELRDFIKGGDK